MWLQQRDAFIYETSCRANTSFIQGTSQLNIRFYYRAEVSNWTPCWLWSNIQLNTPGVTWAPGFCLRTFWHVASAFKTVQSCSVAEKLLIFYVNRNQTCCILVFLIDRSRCIIVKGVMSPLLHACHTSCLFCVQILMMSGMFWNLLMILSLLVC